MSFGIGMLEMLVVLVFVLVVVGLQQFFVFMCCVGCMVVQVCSMVKEFQVSFDEIGCQIEFNELCKEIEVLKQVNLIEEIRGEIDQVVLEVQNDEICKLKMVKVDLFLLVYLCKLMIKFVFKLVFKL